MFMCSEDKAIMIIIIIIIIIITIIIIIIVVNVQPKRVSLSVNQWEHVYLGYLPAIFGGRE